MAYQVQPVVNAGLHYRAEVKASDIAAVRIIVESSQFFYPHEVDVAVEVVEERLSKGEKSGYFFLFAEHQDETIGYTSYGPIPCTKGSAALYWIAVLEPWRKNGIGKELLSRTEEDLVRQGARQLYVDTSGRGLYAATRKFYRRCGYAEVARLKDYYAPGDDKIIFCKQLLAP